MMPAATATGAAAVMIAPVAIPPPTTLPMAAMPEAMDAPPAVPAAPADDAIAAPSVPDVADIMVAAEPPATAEAVEPAAAAVAPAPARPALVEFLISLVIFSSLIKLFCRDDGEIQSLFLGMVKCPIVLNWCFYKLTLGNVV